MNYLLLANFSLFIFINSVTPGPNNLMLLHGGIKAGFRACYPHIFGISLGLAIMLALSYWGMATAVTELPAVMLILKILGTSYLLWLAWHMWNDGIVPEEKLLNNEKQLVKTNHLKSNSRDKNFSAQGTSSQTVQEYSKRMHRRNGKFLVRLHFQNWTLPLNTWQAMLFQWINPKVWIMVSIAPSIYLITGNNPLLENLPLCVLAFVINQCSISIWAAGGHSLQRLLHKQRLMKIIHVAIVLMTIYCAVSLWFGE